MQPQPRHQDGIGMMTRTRTGRRFLCQRPFPACLLADTDRARPPRPTTTRPGRHSREVIYLAPYLRDRDLTKKREGTGGRLISA